MNIGDYTLSHWTKAESVAVIDHEMYDLAHLLVNKHTPLHSSKGVDVFRLEDEKDIKSQVGIELHRHLDFVEFNLVVSGSATAKIENETVPIRMGDVLCILPGQWHVNIPTPQIAVRNLLVSVDLLRDQTRFLKDALDADAILNLSGIIHLSGDSIPQIGKLMSLIKTELDCKKPYYRDQICNLINEMLIVLKRDVDAPVEYQSDRQMGRVLDYIDQHYPTVTLKEAAAINNYNPAYFSRIFHETTGFRFNEYVNNIRVNQAIILLTTTDKTIENICFAVGLSSKTHFYNIFKSRTGLNPGVLRSSKGPELLEKLQKKTKE